LETLNIRGEIHILAERGHSRVEAGMPRIQAAGMKQQTADTADIPVPSRAGEPEARPRTGLSVAYRTRTTKNLWGARSQRSGRSARRRQDRPLEPDAYGDEDAGETGGRDGEEAQSEGHGGVDRGGGFGISDVRSEPLSFECSDTS
jgi:hypothetical protein